MNTDDLREQLLQVKKAHSTALRENAHCRTRLRIAERECKRRETEIQRLLATPNWRSQNSPSSGGAPSPDSRIELAALKRKLILYERMMHDKSQENAKLITDKSVVQASETRKQLDRLEVECQRLRAHLAQSVPEQEFLREKDQYLAIINRLVDENMHLRQVIGQFEHRRRESEKLLSQLGGGEALVRQFRHSSISTRRQANFYRNALGNLLRGQPKPAGGASSFRLRSESTNSAIFSRAANGNGLASIRALLENKTKPGKRRRASVASGEEHLLVEELNTLEEEEHEEEALADGQKQTNKKQQPPLANGRRKEKAESPGKIRNGEEAKMKKHNANKANDGDILNGKEELTMNGTTGTKNGTLSTSNGMANGHQRHSRSVDSDQPNKPKEDSQGEADQDEEDATSESGSFENNASGRNGRQRKVKKERQGSAEEEQDMAVGEEEEEEEEEAVDEAEEPDDLETHLTALYRVLHAHALRQQMAKVRHEREPPNHNHQHLMAGGNLF